MPTVAEHLPGEPALPSPSAPVLAGRLLRHLLISVVLCLVVTPLWPLFLVFRLWKGRAPVVPPAGRFLRLARVAIAGRPPSPGIPLADRLLVLCCMPARIAAVPAVSLAWWLDELLYGRDLARVEIRSPIFELSAARSGSTQLAHYLEDDPRIVAPNLLQIMLPFLWLWKLAPHFARFVSVERVRAWSLGNVPPAYLQRHELDPFRTDTFEIAHFFSQLGDLFVHTHPDAFVAELGWARITPTNETFWEEGFVRFIDGIARRTLVWKPGRRLMIKGHFLAAARLLETRYPDARFLTVVRDPVVRLRSVINFHRVAPALSGFPPVPWGWLVHMNVPLEIDYCEEEQAFYEDSGPARRVVVRFEEYVRDLPGTLRRVYAACLDLEPPAGLHEEHTSRVRSGYQIDRTLPQLGIDAEEFAARVATYVRWCRPAPARATG